MSGRGKSGKGLGKGPSKRGRIEGVFRDPSGGQAIVFDYSGGAATSPSAPLASPPLLPPSSTVDEAEWDEASAGVLAKSIEQLRTGDDAGRRRAMKAIEQLRPWTKVIPPLVELLKTGDVPTKKQTTLTLSRLCNLQGAYSPDAAGFFVELLRAGNNSGDRDLSERAAGAIRSYTASRNLSHEHHSILAKEMVAAGAVSLLVDFMASEMGRSESFWEDEVGCYALQALESLMMKGGRVDSWSQIISPHIPQIIAIAVEDSTRGYAQQGFQFMAMLCEYAPGLTDEFVRCGALAAYGQLVEQHCDEVPFHKHLCLNGLFKLIEGVELRMGKVDKYLRTLMDENKRLKAQTQQDVVDCTGDDVVVVREVAPPKRSRPENPAPPESGLKALKAQQDKSAGEMGRVKRELEAKKGECEDAQDRILCVICMEDDAPRTILFQPCNHFVACAACGSMVKACPFCNGAIKSRIQIANSS